MFLVSKINTYFGLLYLNNQNLCF